MKKFFLLVILLIILTPVFALGMMGFIPGLSSILGADKPRDLGVKYTAADLSSVRSKSQIEYATLPPSTSPLQTRQFTGAREIKGEFSSAEITASLNNQNWVHWPYKNVQIKFNADGSGEISGILIKDKLPGYATAIGVPTEALAFVMKYLPADPVFYVKMKATLENNKVGIFEPQSLQIGRIPLPLDIILSFNNQPIIKEVFAQDFSGMTSELSKIQNKRGLIIDFINTRLSSDFGNFFAKKASFGENKLIFDGTLSEKISYTP
jgi:hypothetical protein